MDLEILDVDAVEGDAMGNEIVNGQVIAKWENVKTLEAYYEGEVVVKDVLQTDGHFWRWIIVSDGEIEYTSPLYDNQTTCETYAAWFRPQADRH